MPAQVPCGGGTSRGNTRRRGAGKGESRKGNEGMRARFGEMSTGLILGLLPLGWVWLWPEDSA